MPKLPEELCRQLQFSRCENMPETIVGARHIHQVSTYEKETPILNINPMKNKPAPTMNT